MNLKRPSKDTSADLALLVLVVGTGFALFDNYGVAMLLFGTSIALAIMGAWERRKK